MTGYWNHRYAAEGMIWGDRPSNSAALAREFFAREGAVRLLVPGAGYGRNARFFSDNHYQVTGVEPAGTALQLAARHDPRTTYLHGSLLDLQLAEESFDAIYCFNVLHLFRENERRLFVQKCSSLLRNNGVVFFTVFSEKEKSFGQGKMVEANTFESKPGRPVHYFTEEDLVSTFSGYTVMATGIMQDEENHGKEGPHSHLLRCIYARKPSLDFDAPKYKAYSKHTKEWGAKIVSELPLRGNESVLDLGCGDGLITRQIADILPAGRVVGIDSSRSMISEAKKLGRDNLCFLLQDITDIDYHEEFDLIFSNAALHWVKDHNKVLGKCHAALKDNGLIRFNFGSQGNCVHFIAVTKELISSAEFSPYFTNFQWPWYMPGPAEYQDLISRFPYRSTRVWEQNADTFFGTADELTGWIDQPSIVPFLKHLDQACRRRFRDRAVERMISLTRQPDGRYLETFRRLNVSAVK
jgi:trans-aconitate methyltransferase